jgi:hypothetical protein
VFVFSPDDDPVLFAGFSVVGVLFGFVFGFSGFFSVVGSFSVDGERIVGVFTGSGSVRGCCLDGCGCAAAEGDPCIAGPSGASTSGDPPLPPQTISVSSSFGSTGAEQVQKVKSASTARWNARDVSSAVRRVRRVNCCSVSFVSSMVVRRYR